MDVSPRATVLRDSWNERNVNTTVCIESLFIAGPVSHEPGNVPVSYEIGHAPNGSVRRWRHPSQQPFTPQ